MTLWPWFTGLTESNRWARGLKFRSRALLLAGSGLAFEEYYKNILTKISILISIKNLIENGNRFQRDIH